MYVRKYTHAAYTQIHTMHVTESHLHVSCENQKVDVVFIKYALNLLLLLGLLACCKVKGL